MKSKKYSLFTPLIALNILVFFLNPGCCGSDGSNSGYVKSASDCTEELDEKEEAATKAYSDSSLLTLEISADKTSFSKAGDIINYSYTVTNPASSTVELFNLTVKDDKVNVSCPNTYSLYHKSIACTGSYTVTQADVELGKIENHATAGTSSAKDWECSYGSADQQKMYRSRTYANTASASLTISYLELQPAITLSMSVEPGRHWGTGQSVTFMYLINNVGNAPLYPEFRIENSKEITPQCDAITTLLPGESLHCTGSYFIDAGIRWDVENVAKVCANYEYGYVCSNYTSAKVRFQQPEMTPHSEIPID